MQQAATIYESESSSLLDNGIFDYQCPSLQNGEKSLSVVYKSNMLSYSSLNNWDRSCRVFGLWNVTLILSLNILTCRMRLLMELLQMHVVRIKVHNVCKVLSTVGSRQWILSKCWLRITQILPYFSHHELRLVNLCQPLLYTGLDSLEQKVRLPYM